MFHNYSCIYWNFALRARIGYHHQGERRPSFLYRLNLSSLPVCRFQVWFVFQLWFCSRSLRASDEPSEPPGAAGAASPEPEDTPGISQEDEKPSGASNDFLGLPRSPQGPPGNSDDPKDDQGTPQKLQWPSLQNLQDTPGMSREALGKS